MWQWPVSARRTVRERTEAWSQHRGNSLFDLDRPVLYFDIGLSRDASEVNAHRRGAISWTAMFATFVGQQKSDCVRPFDASAVFC